jgi:hypothetical protein
MRRRFRSCVVFTAIGLAILLVIVTTIVVPTIFLTRKANNSNALSGIILSSFLFLVIYLHSILKLRRCRLFSIVNLMEPVYRSVRPQILVIIVLIYCSNYASFILVGIASASSAIVGKYSMEVLFHSNNFEEFDFCTQLVDINASKNFENRKFDSIFIKKCISCHLTESSNICGSKESSHAMFSKAICTSMHDTRFDPALYCNHLEIIKVSQEIYFFDM